MRKLTLTKHKARKINKLVDNPQVEKVGATKPLPPPPAPKPAPTKAEVKPPKPKKKGASDEAYDEA